MKSEKLEARISPVAKDLIRQASQLQGLEMSEFVVTTLVEKAKEVIEDASVLRLSQESFNQVLDMIDRPARKPSSKLVSALKRHARRESLSEQDLQPK